MLLIKRQSIKQNCRNYRINFRNQNRTCKPAIPEMALNGLFHEICGYYLQSKSCLNETLEQHMVSAPLF